MLLLMLLLMLGLIVLKISFFCTNKHEHKQQSATLNCRKIWAIAQKIVNKFFRIIFACAQLFFFL